MLDNSQIHFQKCTKKEKNIPIMKICDGIVHIRRVTLKFSLNVFTELALNSVKKNLKIKNEQCGAGTQDLLCKRQE